MFIRFQCFSDELPVQLMLPKAIQEAKNRQQLSSLALLGQGWFGELNFQSFYFFVNIVEHVT